MATLVTVGVVSGLLVGCATPPPKEQSNICSIFREHPSWYEDALDMQKSGATSAWRWLLLNKSNIVMMRAHQKITFWASFRGAVW